MPMAWVMSSVCSVSSQLPPALVSTQEVLVPSVETRVIGTLLVWSGVLEVSIEVGEIGAEILEQAEVLAGAGE